MPLTRSVEDYLKAIYHIAPGEEPATTNQIADRLGLSAPSVSGMVKRLSDSGFLEHVPYRGVVLTEAGRRLALQVVRRHRLIEAYLVRFLGYSWDSVHDEAERLEHAVSDLLVDRMAAALGNPRVDPHGDPIPAVDGSIEESAYTALAEIPEGETVEIRRVDTSQGDRLRYLHDHGLVPGSRVRVTAHHPFSGPLVLQVGDDEEVIGHELAAQILCSRGVER
jgi:DtxR family Mn-dependent transcriptional regulator